MRSRSAEILVLLFFIGGSHAGKEDLEESDNLALAPIVGAIMPDNRRVAQVLHLGVFRFERSTDFFGAMLDRRYEEFSGDTIRGSG